MPLTHSLLFLIFTLSLTTQAQSSLHDPNHSILTLNLPEDLPALPSSRMLSSLYPKIRISTNFDALNQISPDYKAYITNELIPPVIDYFQATFKIKYPSILPITLPESVNTACGLQLPRSLYNEGIDTDFLWMIDSQEDKQRNWLAESSVCFLTSGTQRPLIARTIINSDLLREAKGDVIKHEKNLYVMMHEMIHVLGFSSSLYKYYLNEDGIPRTGHIKTINDRLVIDVPSLTAKLRDYFGCEDLEGTYMENDGGRGSIGSHFERRHFLYEVMSSGSISGRRVSEFSLGMLEASGWYIPDYDMAEPYYFGKGKGCGFIREEAGEFEEFCQGEVKGCDANRRGAGFCSGDRKTEGYRYIMPEDSYDCENEEGIWSAKAPKLEVYGRGKSSKCFMGSLDRFNPQKMTSFCLRYKCETGENKEVKVKVWIGDKQVNCVKEGLIKVDGYEGGVECPEPERFCETIGKEYCPRGCMGRGVCKENKCECEKGYNGIDCSHSEVIG